MSKEFSLFKPLMKYHLDIELEPGNPVKTWGVIPILSTSKILHGVYHPELKHLRLYLDSSIEQYKSIPVEVRGKIKVEQRKLDTYYSVEVTEDDIPFFLENYVENNFEIKNEQKDSSGPGVVV